MALLESKPLVLLTGPNGFVGAHVLDRLLSEGYFVRGTPIFKRVIRCRAGHSGTKALDGAMADVGLLEMCDYVCYVASPYFTVSNDPLKELIEPAVNGTKNVVSSALKVTKPKRLTIMSSFASVVDLSKNPRAGYIYTDHDWDPVILEQGQEDGYWGYYVSKTFAERAAWDIWKAAKPSWDLVSTVKPSLGN